MGQYWYVVNLDKKEFLHPHTLGCGLKLVEQVGTVPGTAAALIMLLAAEPRARGGGDFDVDNPKLRPVVGRWAGDRIALIGDYAQPGDLPGERADLIWKLCQLGREDATPEERRQWRQLLEEQLCLRYPELAEREEEMAQLLAGARPYREISSLVAAALEEVFGGRFVGYGWRRFVPGNG
jgi:hypothetical protein